MTKAFFLILALLAGAAEAVTDTFIASGNWTAPPGVTSVTVEAWGGGGGGGAATGNPAKGGGGAGGQYARKVVTVVPGNIYAVVVGAGGTVGAAVAGGIGGDSTFAATTVVAKGGAGGALAAVNSSCAAAGVGSATGGVGDPGFVFAGGSGSACAVITTPAGGAGGGGAGSTGAGGSAVGNTAGAGTATGGGAGGAGLAARAAGNPGVVAGGGGGAGYATKKTNQSGGLGAAGMVTISYVAAPVATTAAATALTVSGATLNGTVSSNGASTTVTFDYGLTIAYGSTVTATASPLAANAVNTAVSAPVAGLTCGTTYHFRVNAVNTAGTTNGGDLTFVTSACPPQVTLTPATGGGAIASNTAPGCSAAGTWTALTGPVVTETVAAQIGLGTIVLSAPAGFEFNTAAAVTILLTGNATASRNINNVATGTSMAVTSITATAITFTVTAVGTRVNTLTWQGIQVRPTADTPLATGNITHTGTSPIAGVTAATNFGTLAEAVSVPACNAAPTVTKSFSAATIVANGTSTLTITITNPNTTAITGLAFTDTYPSANLKNASAPALANSCGGTATGAAGASTLSLSGGTLPGGGSCSVSVSVTPAAAGSYLNSTGAVTSTNAASGAAASATLTVTAISAANSTVVASPTSVPADNSTTSTITVTLKDAAGNGVSGKTVTLAAGSGSSTISAASGPSDAGGIVTFTVKDATAEGPITYTATDTTDAIVVTQTAQVTFVATILNCTSNASGNWTLPATWINCRGGIPLLNDHVTILGAHTVTLDTTTPVLGNLTNGGTLNASGTFSLNIGGNLVNNGTMSLGATNVSLYGNFSNTAGASFNPGATDSGTWTFSGTALQNIDSTGILTTFPNLVLDNSFGIALNASATIKTLLTLTNGYISTGTNILILSANCNAPGWLRTNGFVAGNLRLTFPAGTTTCTYPVGSGTTYAPIGVTMVASVGGTLTGNTVGNEHPQIASSAIDPNKDANRHWSLWMAGDTVVATSYGATFNFVSGDLDIAATATSFMVGKYVGGVWSLPVPVSATATSTGVSNVAGPITAANTFAVGEVPAACEPPTGIPGLPVMTCVCDNFGRASLNPSTIFGQNWIVGNSGGTFGNPRIVNPGYLRLTDNSGGVSTVANVPSSFPAAGNLIVVEFKHFAYSGTGADGIAMTLSDALLTPTPGAFGGSLGYAQKSNPGSDCVTPGGCPGFNGGWVGVAVDEYGNFSSNTEGRSGGTAPGLILDSVSVRGSGAGQTGYPYLAGSATLAPGIDNAASLTAAFGHSYRIMVDARNYTPAARTTLVSVDRDTTGSGASYTPVVPAFDAYTANLAQADVPANWKLSFTGSTGGAWNIHEISGLKICAQAITPPAGYIIQVDNLSPSSCGTPGGIPASPVVTVRAVDAIGNTITNYTGIVNLAATLSGGAASAAVWSVKTGGGTLVGNQYTFAAADLGVAQFYLADASSQDVYLAVTESDGSPSTSLATPVQYRGGSFSVAITDVLGSEVVAGRSHRMSITRTNCGTGTDTAYIGAKSLDGWYNPTVGDHPAGANAPQICNLNGSNSCQPAAGSTCSILSIASPALSAASNNLSLSFALGVADFCLVTSDVGKYSLGLRDDSNILSPVNGYSTTLTARPFAVVVSDVRQGAVNNPANGASGGGIFAKAGTAFQAAVAGYLWSSTGDTGSNGFPGAAADLSAIIAAGIAPSYADSVTLAAGAPFAPVPATGPPLFVAGALSNGSVAVTSGSATQTTLSYNEVGSFTLTATPATSYLNTAGVDLGNRVAIFSNPPSTSRNGLVGRFIPDRFGLSGTPAITGRSDIGSGAGCTPASAFTYMSEPMKVAFNLAALNSGGGVTQNYAGNYAKLNTTDWIGNFGAGNSVGLWMVASSHPVPPGTCTVVFGSGPATTFNCTGVANPADIIAAGARVAMSATPAAPVWNNGLGAFSGDAVLLRANAPDGPYAALNIGIAPQDADGVTFSAYGLDADNSGTNERVSIGAMEVRFGRLKLANAHGSELLGLPVSVQAQYWNGAAFVPNEADNCTVLNPNNIALGNYQRKTGDTWTTSPALTNMTAIQGVWQVNLSKPSPMPTGKGSVDLCVDLDADPVGGRVCSAAAAANFPYLQGLWSPGASYNNDPGVRATFGVFKGNNEFIYMRETY